MHCFIVCYNAILCLPVGYCGVENLIDKFFNHLFAELVLHLFECRGAGKCAVCRECAFEVFVGVGVVGKTDAHADGFDALRLPFR